MSHGYHLTKFSKHIHVTSLSHVSISSAPFAWHVHTFADPGWPQNPSASPRETATEKHRSCSADGAMPSDKSAQGDRDEGTQQEHQDDGEAPEERTYLESTRSYLKTLVQVPVVVLQGHVTVMSHFLGYFGGSRHIMERYGWHNSQGRG